MPINTANNISKMGTWQLQNNNSITFYSIMDDLGTIKRDSPRYPSMMKNRCITAKNILGSC